MYLNNTSTQYKQYQDFEKYARFICESFNISVVLDSTRAETDGKTIYLPNLASMTYKELDMMYAILLHEAGHIRYSTFDESYFKALKSQAHAFLANSIEDARIENLLMKDFGGATDIFTNLYCDYAQDKQLMKKIFKHDGKRPDLFTTLAFYTHNKIINCETARLEDIAGVYRARRIMKFWNENDIDNLIVQNGLKKPLDVISLTNEIYDLFSKKFMDDSEKVSVYDKLQEQKKVSQLMEDLKKEGLQVEKQVQVFQEKIKNTQEQIDKFDKLHEEQINNLQEKINENYSKIEIINSKINFKQDYDKNTKLLETTNSHIAKLLNDINKEQERLKALEEKLASGVIGRSKKPMLEEQKEFLQKKIDNKKNLLNKLEEKLDFQEQLLANAAQELEQADRLALYDSEQYDKNLDIESIVQQKNKHINENNKKQAEINRINKGKERLVKQFNSYIDIIEKVQNKYMEKVAKSLFDLDKETSEEFGLEVMPELNYEDVWPEAAQAQEVFDKKATKISGKVIRNGEKVAGVFGSNVRDIISYIDKAIEQVEEIDIVQIFKEKISPSKLADFNSEKKAKHHMDDKTIVGIPGTHREHIPLTTMFDSIKNENVSLEKNAIKELMKKNADFYRDLKRVFNKKFKFAKKDLWRGNQEEGNLDVRNLYKLPTNQGDDFYEIAKKKYVNKTAATILVDISNSNNKEVTEYGEKIKELVLGISLALDDVHIKHEILGFHAPVCEDMRQADSSVIYTRRSNNLETIIYKLAQQKDNCGIMNIQLQMSDNSDGESLRIACKRLKAIQAKSHLLFMISDGKPFLCDTDVSVLDEDLRSALRQAVQQKIQLVGLGFFNELENFFGNRFCNATNYKNVIEFFDKTYFKV